MLDRINSSCLPTKTYKSTGQYKLTGQKHYALYESIQGHINHTNIALPILAIGIPHCNTCTVVSTADCTSGKWHVADIV
jgi:hypothetical protein